MGCPRGNEDLVEVERRGPRLAAGAEAVPGEESVHVVHGLARAPEVAFGDLHDERGARERRHHALEAIEDGALVALDVDFHAADVPERLLRQKGIDWARA